MYYIIYKTTNIVNGKIYVGAHETNNLNDSYLGSGKYLLRAVKKYGRNKFKREILYVFNNETQMYLKEQEIVNAEFVSRKDTYNIVLGGFKSVRFVKGTIEYDNWYNKYKKTVPQSRSKNSNEYKEWYRRMIDSCPSHKNKLSDDFLSWVMKNPAMCDNKSDKYKLWLNKVVKSAPQFEDKKSKRYEDWEDKQQRSLPQHLPHDDPKYIEWNKVNSPLASKNGKKKRGNIWIKNLKSHETKHIKPSELDSYSKEGWVRGRGNFMNR